MERGSMGCTDCSYLDRAMPDDPKRAAARKEVRTAPA